MINGAGNKVVLVTGAGGFIGRHIVQAARARGYDVRAVVRHKDGILEGWTVDNAITPVVCDLSNDAPNLDGVDCVIHAAASMAGDDAIQARTTIAATETLLGRILAQDSPPHLVLVSSISVYDTLPLPVGGVMDEDCALESDPEGRDAYCRAKLAQEAMVQDAVKAGNLAVTILRPGAIYGQGRVWNDHIGVGFGPVLVRFGRRGQVPVCAVTHCADAIVRAVDNAPETGAVDVVNVLDDDLPDRARFVRILRSGGWPKFVVPLPWLGLDGLAVMLEPVFGARLPGLLRRRVLHARLKPLTYSNEKLREQYGLDSPDWFETEMLRALDPDIFGRQST